MKFFIAAIIATLAAADGNDWTEKAACATYLDAKARWLAAREKITVFPALKEDWEDDAKATYDA